MPVLASCPSLGFLGLTRCSPVPGWGVEPWRACYAHKLCTQCTMRGAYLEAYWWFVGRIEECWGYGADTCTWQGTRGSCVCVCVCVCVCACVCVSILCWRVGTDAGLPRATGTHLCWIGCKGGQARLREGKFWRGTLARSTANARYACTNAGVPVSGHCSVSLANAALHYLPSV